MAIKTMIIEYDDAVGDMIGGFPLRSPAVEVVKCSDCRHYADHEWIISPKYGLGTDVEHVCHFWHGEPTKVAADGFCAWAERRA